MDMVGVVVNGSERELIGSPLAEIFLADVGDSTAQSFAAETVAGRERKNFVVEDVAVFALPKPGSVLTKD